MQNLWVRDPEKVGTMFRRHGEAFRLQFIQYALFRGCLTGRRLKSAFGDDCKRIIWEESTKQIAGDPKTIFPADHLHMVDVIRTYKPTVIITFGRIAHEALQAVFENHNFAGTCVIILPHPAARQATVPARLKQGAEEFRRLLATYVR